MFYSCGNIMHRRRYFGAEYCQKCWKIMIGLLIVSKIWFFMVTQICCDCSRQVFSNDKKGGNVLGKKKPNHQYCQTFWRQYIQQQPGPRNITTECHSLGATRPNEKHLRSFKFFYVIQFFNCLVHQFPPPVLYQNGNNPISGFLTLRISLTCSGWWKVNFLFGIENGEDEL